MENSFLNQPKPFLVFSLFFSVIGLFLFLGGIQLVLVGGSLYYLITGIILLVIAWAVGNKKTIAAILYQCLLGATVVWSVYEVGFDIWGLVPRLVAPTVLGLIFLLPPVQKRLSLSKFINLTTLIVISLISGLLGFSFFNSIFKVESGDLVSENFNSKPTDFIYNWSTVGGSLTGTKHIQASQISRNNVADLIPAWIYEVSTNTDSDITLSSVTPLSVDDKLFLCASNNLLISLDAETGEELWRHDPEINLEHVPYKSCRGVAFHSANEKKNGNCQSRILAGTLDNRLIAVDANTGRPCEKFGQNGALDLNIGLGKILPGYRYVTSPPVIMGNVAIVGGFIYDNQSAYEPSGVVKAFDVDNGELLWAWDFLSPKGIRWDPTQADFTKNTPNFWSMGSGDEDLGLVYLPTGNTPPDFYGGHRSPEQDRYASSVVALEISSGDVKWSFQTVYHDVWDYDVPSQPVLVEWNTGTETVPALILATKRGEIFVLDRRNGQPLTDVKEQVVPQTDIPEGEWLSKTQPFSVGFPSFAPDDLDEEAMWGATPIDQLWCRIKFLEIRYEGKFTPQSEQGALNYPGNFGVFNWGGMSVDTTRDILVVNTAYFPWYQRLIKREEADKLGIVPYGESSKGTNISTSGPEIYYAQAGTPYAVDSRPFISPLGYPCHAPPWGELAAIDLKSQKVKWRRPLGTTEEVAPLGLTFPTGVFNIGGPITSSQGLIFIGAAIDDYIRAFDIDNGEELWKARLPAGGQATPISYVSSSGEQYVVIAAGGHAPLDTKLGDYLLAYKLPN